MAKIQCPKCRGYGLTMEEDGYLRCDRVTVLHRVEDADPGHAPLTLTVPCGYRGFEAVVEMTPDEMVDSQTKVGAFTASMIDGISIAGEDPGLAVSLEAVGADLTAEPLFPVPEDPIVEKLLAPVAVALYAAHHGVTPDDMTPAGNAEAWIEWRPFLKAVAAPVWAHGFEAAADLALHDDWHHVNPFEPSPEES